jgi:hypothetical protein
VTPGRRMRCLNAAVTRIGSALLGRFGDSTRPYGPPLDQPRTQCEPPDHSPDGCPRLISGISDCHSIVPAQF